MFVLAQRIPEAPAQGAAQTRAECRNGLRWPAFDTRSVEQALNIGNSQWPYLRRRPATPRGPLVAKTC